MNKNNRMTCADGSTKTSRTFAGLIVIAVGIAIFLKQIGVEMPSWLFSWPMLLIVIGIYSGVKHRFQNFGWVFIVLPGLFFLLDKYFLDIQIGRFIVPVLIIAAGLFMIFKSRINDTKNQLITGDGPVEHNNDDNNTIDSMAMLGGVKKNVISKDFKGGKISSIFGGSEINLTHTMPAKNCVLETTNILGGTQLIVPSNWVIKSELTAVMGGIEDKRMQAEIADENPPVVVLKGVAILGGIEIKSY